MGNAALRELAAIEDVSWAALEGSVIAVDAHNWLYRYLTTTVRFTNEQVYTTEAGTEVANLIGIIQGLPKFFEHDLTPVFVFDGAVSDLKSEEIAQRRKQRKRYEAELEQARERGDTVEIATLESRTQQLTETIVETTLTLLDYLDIPIVEAPAEGEAQAAVMARSGLVDFAGTEDYDALLFGAPQTLRQLTSSGSPECMDLEKTLDRHGLSWEQLVDVGILCGTDFNEGIDGVGPKTAVKLVQEHWDLWGVFEAKGYHIDGADRLQQLFLDPAVTTDLDLDLQIEPDLNRAKAYVTDEWEIPANEIERGFDRIESSLTQTGLDRWT